MDKKAEKDRKIFFNSVLTVVSIGMVVIALRGLTKGAAGSHQLGIIGCLLALWATVRWRIFIREYTDWEK